MRRIPSRLLAGVLVGLLLLPSTAAAAGAPVERPARPDTGSSQATADRAQTPAGSTTASAGRIRTTEPSAEATSVADEIIVVFKPGTARAARAAADAAAGARAVKHARVAGSEAELVKVPAGKNRSAVERSYRSRTDVARVQPNFLYHPADATTPNDPQFGSQWSLRNAGGADAVADADIDADDAWSTTKGDPSVVVAVTDTGVDYRHPELSANMWANTDEVAGNGIDDDGNGYVDDIRGWDFMAEDSDPSDVFGHGTHVAGIIAAKGNNAAGIAGVAWNVKIMPLKVMDDTGTGDTFSAVEAVEYAAANGADVINASWGAAVDPYLLEGDDYLLKSAIEASGVLFVAAAGNNKDSNDSGSRFYPASFDSANILAVAASNANDEIDADYSNYGRYSVDLAAPGTNILSTVPWDKIVYDDFSSFDGWDVTSVGTQWSNSYADASLIEYGDNENAVITYRTPVDLSGPGDYSLSFLSYVNSEQYYDVLRAQVSVDGGSSWDTLWSSSGFMQSHYTDQFINLSAYQGEPDVRFRFVFQTDGSYGPQLGQALVFIDDFAVVRTDYANAHSNAYELMSGTSMAAPHVAGVAALALSVNPDMNALTLKRLLMSNVDVKSSMAGKTMTAGRLNAQKVVAAAPSAPMVAGVNRLAGANRYATAVAIAKRAHPSWAGVTDVIIASGEDRAAADPLAAAGLVWAYHGAPLLLVDSRAVPVDVTNAVRQIAATSAGNVQLHIVGGTSAVPSARVAELLDIFQVAGVSASYDRIGGVDRFDTARKIAQTMVAERGAEMPGDVLVANGVDPASFYDALALSPIAANRGTPVLLVSQAAVPSATQAMIGTLSPDRVIIGGGVSAVSADVATSLAEPGRSVARWSGASRYDTAATIAANAVGEGMLSAKNVAVAAALPDALSSASITGATGGPLLLTSTTSVSTSTSSWLTARKGTVSQAWILGGTSSVSSGQDAVISGLLN